MLSAVLVIFFLYLFYACCRKHGEKYASTQPPIFPGALPIIGHSLMLAGNTRLIYKTVRKIESTMIKTNQYVVKLKFGIWNFYAISDPEDCCTAANSCLDKHYAYKFGKGWVGDGLITAPVPIWKRHRKLICRALSQPVLETFIEVFNANSRFLMKKLDNQVGRGSFNHSELIRDISLETICSTAMGFRDGDNGQLKNAYTTAARKLMAMCIERMLKFWLHNDFIYALSDLKRRFDEETKIIAELSRKVILQKKEEMKKRAENGTDDESNPRFKAFLDQLLELSNEGALTEAEVTNEVDTMIVAGYETVAGAMTTALTLIGSHSDVQEKAYAELQEVFGDSDRDVDKVDLTQLKYIEAVLKETMRLYPPAPVVVRYLYRDVKLKNYTLPAGSNCFFFLCGINRHPVWGEDANEFKPERWLDPATLPDNPSAIATFSIGRRNCIGGNYALMLMKATLAHVLRRYRITADVSKMVMKLQLTLVAHSGHEITLERR